MILRGKNKTAIEFGTGDVAIGSKVSIVGSEVQGLVELSEIEPGLIGRKKISECKSDVDMRFANIESLDVVIHSLAKLRKAMEKEMLRKNECGIAVVIPVEMESDNDCDCEECTCEECPLREEASQEETSQEENSQEETSEEVSTKEVNVDSEEEKTAE
ncbi:hypothetical protein BFS06_13740 [Clostridium perfringens]|uniref:Uncharacterized protein n=1 Tax=Clostridium perfringens TaxID=1502 RepID=A0A140GRS4_CLOPF|nr:hypothetical protein [Clostridium perfringens]AMN31233.1 hypothetical protein JFP838_pA0317 [Clostridium perfringens]TBX14267.1 hypothetical protein BFS06_13740 [Clostridium perfringens]